LFFESAQELLQTLNEDALKLEKQPGDLEIVRSIRRTVHTLKGDAAACGFSELSELAHELEDALAQETAAVRAALVEVAFTAADAFAAMLASYRNQTSLPASDPLRRMIREIAAEAGEPSAPQVSAPAPAQWSEYEQLAMRTALSQGRRVYRVTATLDPLCAMPIAARQLILNALASIGEVLGAPSETNLPQSTKHLQVLLASARPTDEIAEKCRIPTVIASVQIEEAADVSSAPQPPAEKAQGGETQLQEAANPSEGHEGAAGGTAASGENILRVEAERIDNLLNLVGELIIGKSMLQQVLNEFSRRFPKDTTRGRFADALAFQARVLNDLQRSVMKVRMVPVEQLFRRFPRMLRDVAKQCGKDVDLVVSGQDTDLDKGLLDAIAEPLTHLVRNAVSHGIEAPAERAQIGKTARGTVRLDAYHQGNHVIVEVSDDGRGIDTERVKAKALEQHLLTADEAAQLSEAALLDLVFRPGFSTAPEITEISGRGVGLDVVQSVLQRLKGTVEIITRAGQGTMFRIKLPLTLAIIKALLFRVEHRLYAIPLNAVAEIARTREAELHEVDRYEVLQLRGQVLQLLRLGRPRSQSAPNPRQKVFVLVIAVGERKLGLVVDALEGEEELVIKAVDDQTVATDLVGGASILGDGRVVLILNLAAVIERSARLRNGDAAGAEGLLLSHAERAQSAAASREARL
jgi:two-component system chemotaxis sensor kinase CheA